MIALSAAPKPQPIPTPAGRQPAEWANVPLVKVEGQYSGYSFAGPYSASDIGAPAGDEVPRERVGAFTRLTEATLPDAVQAASRLSRMRPIMADNRLAIAVLQAGDGAFYATALSGASSRWPMDSRLAIDPRPGFSISSIEALHPDVKAVVGTGTWYDLTDGARS